MFGDWVPKVFSPALSQPTGRLLGYSNVVEAYTAAAFGRLNVEDDGAVEAGRKFIVTP